MKAYSLLTTILCTLFLHHAEGQLSLSNILGLKGQFLRGAIVNSLTPTSENSQNLRLAKELNLLQPRVNVNVQFPCTLNSTRSETRPNSVHALRPADIDVIAAIGDSLTAGNGLVATNILQVLVQNRGIAASIGGQGNWREYLTLPNILKEFNPNLVGYSLKDSFRNEEDSEFNVADSSARSSSMPAMAKKLVGQIRNDSRINFETDWKMITILIGGNDFCNEMCQQRYPEKIVENHEEDLTQTLRILRDGLPRTIVNLILTPRLEFLTRMSQTNRPILCYISQPYLCPCLFSYQYQTQPDKYNQIMIRWQQVQLKVVMKSEFDTDDFTVVVSPFIENYRLARTSEGLTDYSFMSQDCFHLSQKGNAVAAISLWNNLLEPVGKKSTTASNLYSFKCPSAEHPYIFTRRNSNL